MTATRRLAAILAADVAGYSRLILADEEGTLNRLRSIRAEVIDPKITENRGRIVKTTGDGLLVEFSSVVDALRCATQWQQGIEVRNADMPPTSRIEFRMGINVGDIAVEDGDIFGDGVNVAARLEGLAEPGGICVSARVQEDVAGRLDLTFDDIGEQNLKNIARPVRVYRVRLATTENTANATPTERRPILTLPDKPSIAVLPFQNMSSDPEQEYFADGMVEEIITALSRYPSLFVIARNSCFTYKGRAVSVTQVGRELGVRYVVEGSLRKSANRIRVTAQLVEAESGNHVWAERYDRDLADIFAVQDEITEKVTIAVAPAIADAELHRAMRKPPGSLDAWAVYQRGLWHLDKAISEDNVLAEKFFQQAIDLDANLADGYCGLAVAQLRAIAYFQTRATVEIQNSAEPLVRQAVALDGNNAVARAWLSYALYMRGDAEGAVAEADHALELSPNLALGYWRRATALIFSGRAQEGLVNLQTSLRLDPRGANLAPRLTQMAVGYYFSRAYEETVAAAKQAIRSFPGFEAPYRYLAAALGQLGRTVEAKIAIEQAIAIAPGSFDMYVRHCAPWWRPEDHIHMVDGLRKAGWRET